LRRLVAAAAGIALLAGSARAQSQTPESGHAPPPTQPAPPPSQPAPPPTQPAPPDDFDLLPAVKPPSPEQLARQEELTRKLRLRRQMLQLHQLGGFVTMGSLALTVTLGQLNYNDKYAGGGDTGRFRTAHKISAYSSAAIFAATGLLAILAPSPTDKPLRLDTAALHKVFLGVATAGIAAQIILGVLTASKEGPPTSLSQRDFALAHQIVGYTTFVATTAGFMVLTF
jgi:hypothetical protein